MHSMHFEKTWPRHACHFAPNVNMNIAVQTASMFTFQYYFVSVKLAIWEASMARFVDSIEYVLQVR